MTEHSAPMVDVWRLWRLGHLPAVIGPIQTVVLPPSIASQARLLLIRCLLDQGRFQQAEALSSSCDEWKDEPVK